VLVGDKPSDLEAARQAHLAFGVHVLTGHGPRDEKLSRALATPDFAVQVVSRADQVAPLLGGDRKHP
jgi:phosphoglycolate phosphatase-like HAD superfamily hydrolase